jgi:hypothetical protein
MRTSLVVTVVGVILCAAPAALAQQGPGRWRVPVAPGALEIFLDMYNITNRANYNNPTNVTVLDRDGADRRLTDSFLRLTTLYGGSGFPRQAQFGLRYAC